MKPFVILALPRTGTKMLVSALESHPQIDKVTHEFNGTEEEFRAHPYVLSNRYHDWMDCTKIALTRENSVAGAKSLLLMTYNNFKLLPPGTVEIPIDEVVKSARFRREQEAEFSRLADYTVSYEDLTEGEDTEELPEWFSRDFCRLVGITPYPLVSSIRQSQRIILKNESELTWLQESNG